MKIRRLILPIIAAGSISVAVPIVHPQPAQAVGFMHNTLVNFANSADNPSVREGIKNLAEILYFVPFLVIVSTVAGVAIASRGQNETVVKVRNDSKAD